MHLFNLKKSLVSLYICLVALLAVVTFVEPSISSIAFDIHGVFPLTMFSIILLSLCHWVLSIS